MFYCVFFDENLILRYNVMGSKIYILMKPIQIIAVLLAISSVAITSTFHPLSSETSRSQLDYQVTRSEVSRQSRIEGQLSKLEHIKASLSKCLEDKDGCSQSAEIKRRLRKQIRIVRRTRNVIKSADKRRALKARRASLKIKLENLKESPQKNARKIDRCVRRLRILRREQERRRVRAVGRLDRKIRRLEKKLKKSSKRVKVCIQNKSAKGCEKILRRHFHQLSQVRRLRSTRATLYRRIVRCRRKHVNTFRKISSIRVKKAILLNRYDVKVRYYERAIERYEKLLVEYNADENQSTYIRQRINKLNTNISNLKQAMEKTIDQKKKVFRLNTSPACSLSVSCAANLHKILNVIHINLVMKSRDGKRTINKKIIVSGGHVRYQRSHKSHNQITKPHSSNLTQGPKLSKKNARYVKEAEKLREYRLQIESAEAIKEKQHQVRLARLKAQRSRLHTIIVSRYKKSHSVNQKCNNCGKHTQKKIIHIKTSRNIRVSKKNARYVKEAKKLRANRRKIETLEAKKERKHQVRVARLNAEISRMHAVRYTKTSKGLKYQTNINSSHDIVSPTHHRSNKVTVVHHHITHTQIHHAN